MSDINKEEVIKGLIQMRSEYAAKVLEFDRMLAACGHNVPGKPVSNGVHDIEEADPMDDGEFIPEVVDVPEVAHRPLVKVQGRGQGRKIVIDVPAKRNYTGRVDWSKIRDRILTVCQHGERTFGDIQSGFHGNASTAQFRSAISKLMEEKKIFKHGDKRGTKYATFPEKKD